jgi:hypothetical protein
MDARRKKSYQKSKFYSNLADASAFQTVAQSSKVDFDREVKQRCMIGTYQLSKRSEAACELSGMNL